MYLRPRSGGRARLTLAAICILGACVLERAPVAPGESVLGPDEEGPAGSVVDRFLVGDPTGPGLLEQGTVLQVAAGEADDLYVHASFDGGPGIQLFRRGRFVDSLGRSGQGPGEFRRVDALALERDSRTLWVVDGARIISLDSAGVAGAVIDRSSLGAWVNDLLLMQDGSFVASAPGGTRESLGYLLHRYDPASGRWSPHLPVYRDSVFVPSLDYRKAARFLGMGPDGTVVAVSPDYVIEVLDPSADFRVVRRLLRGPREWPSDVGADLAARRAGQPFAPGYSVTDVYGDGSGVVWVLSVLPKEDWEADLVPDPTGHSDLTLRGPDFGLASMVEAIDPLTGRVLMTTRFDGLYRGVIGAGRVVRYTGDEPFPRLEVTVLSREEA